jgi:glycine/D-amino acid oxidase-like deaminating enzyme
MSAMSPETCDVLIVGAGACGSVVARELSARGFSVVVIEAGRRFDAATDLANSEANAGKIMWTEPRNFVGKDFVIPKAESAWVAARLSGSASRRVFIRGFSHATRRRCGCGLAARLR